MVAGRVTRLTPVVGPFAPGPARIPLNRVTPEQHTEVPMLNDIETIETLREENARLRQRLAAIEQRQAPPVNTRPSVDLLHLLQCVIEHIPAGIFVLDLHGHTLLVNQHAAVQIHPPTEAQHGNGAVPPGHLPPEVLEAWQTIAGRVATTGQPIEIEETVTYEHEQRTFLVSWFPIYAAGEALVAVGVMATDVTERRQVEEQLHLAKFALDHCVDSVHWVGPDGRHIYVNDAACQKLGYSHDELMALSVADIDPDTTEEAWNVAWHAMRKHRVLTFESHHRCKDGTILPVEVAANYLEFNGKAYICSFARDLSKRKRMEDELRTFQTLVEYAPDAISVSDLEGTIVYANPAYRDLYGYGEATIGMHVSKTVPPEAEASLTQGRQLALQQGFWRGEGINQRSDGSQFPIQSSLFVIWDERGMTRTVAAINRDITPFKQAEAERTRLQQQIIDAQHAALRELSTPLLPIADGVVIMPLVGMIDTRRAQEVMEGLLEGVARYRARTVILDITSVQVIDTQVATALLHAARAVRLLGAQVMLTGIGPEMAQSMVHLGVDLEGVMTRGSLQAGIAQVLRI